MTNPGYLGGADGLDAAASIPRPLRGIPRGLLRLRSDAGLCERVAAGDESAFAVLYERHHALVLAIGIGVLGSRQDAEDAAQETFAALAVCLRGRPPRELRPWLVRVSRNAAIDLARRRRAHPPLGEASVDASSLASGIRHELDSVLAGIRELPESQRTALLLRELAGHSYDEIAAMLNIDQQAVRGLIARARIGLRNYREATELPCASVRAALAVEPDGRRRDKTVRRHLRGCASCQAYRAALRSDAKALRALGPAPAGALAGGGAAAGVAAKGALAGGTMSQVGAVCAASVCSVGGFVMLYEHRPSQPLRPSSRTVRTSAAALAHRHRVTAEGRVALALGPAGVTIGDRDFTFASPAAYPRESGATGKRLRSNRSAHHTTAGLSMSLVPLTRDRPRHDPVGSVSAGGAVGAGNSRSTGAGGVSDGAAQRTTARGPGAWTGRDGSGSPGPSGGGVGARLDGQHGSWGGTQGATGTHGQFDQGARWSAGSDRPGATDGQRTPSTYSWHRGGSQQSSPAASSRPGTASPRGPDAASSGGWSPDAQSAAPGSDAPGAGSPEGAPGSG